jgi:tetratricopeptide (TPR) repeat protein
MAGAIDAYEQAFRRIAPVERVSRARLKRKQAAEFNMRGLPAQAEAALVEASSLLGPFPETAPDPRWFEEWLEARLESGDALFYMNEAERMQALVAELEPAMAHTTDPLFMAKYDELRVFCAMRTRRMVADSEMLALAECASASYRKTGSPAHLLRAEMIIAVVTLLSPKDRPRAIRYLHRYLELSRRHRHPVHQLEAMANLAVWHRLHGDERKVSDYSQKIIRRSEESQQTVWYRANGLGNLSWVAWRSGDLAGAQELALRAMHDLDETPALSPWEWQVRWTLLALAVGDNDWAEAGDQADAMLDPSQQRLPDDVEELLRGMVAAHACDYRELGTVAERLIAAARVHGYL